MTWSELEGDGVLTGAYTICVRDQAVRHHLPVRYTSYELLCYRSRLSQFGNLN